MEIDGRDLICAVAKHHGITAISDAEDALEQIKNLPPDVLTEEFCESWNAIIAPILHKADNDEEIAEDELRELIPDEIYENLHIRGADGKPLMSMLELKESLAQDNIFSRPHNSNTVVETLKEQLKASYAHNDYPFLSALENSWLLLSDDYKVIDREKQPASSPLESFIFYVDMGFYPPPELLLYVKEAFDLYMHSQGEVSLDEAFFGQEHRKKRSFSFKKKRDFKYSYLENAAKRVQEKEGISFEAAMEASLTKNGDIGMIYLGVDPRTDIDSFMRGYRRWKAEITSRDT